MSRPTVEIVYCADCGYAPNALGLAADLLATFGNGLAAVTIRPWDEGTFDVSVDGSLIHSMSREGGFPAPETIGAAIRERLAAQREA